MLKNPCGQSKTAKSDAGRSFNIYVESIGLMTDKQMAPSLVPTTLHAFMRNSAMVPIRIALDDENPPVQLGLSVLVGIRKGAESESIAKKTNATKNGTATISRPSSSTEPSVTKL